MSDIQDLIHKTTIDCLTRGERVATERIINLLEDQKAKMLSIDTGHGAGNENMSVRIKTIDVCLELIKAEANG